MHYTYVTHYVIIITFLVTSNICITKYVVKTGNITQVTLLTNAMHYLSNEVSYTVMILLHNITTTSNEVTDLIGNPLSNVFPQ